MKRQTWRGEIAIADAPAVITVHKYAHNSAMHAARDVLRDNAHGGYWEPESVTKTKDADNRFITETIVDYVHTGDGRTARITVYPID